MRPWGSSICRFFRFCTILFHFCYFQFKALRLFVLRLRSQTNASTSSILSEKSPAWLTILTQIVCLESGSYPLNKHSNQMPITSRFLLPVLHFRCYTAFILHSIWTHSVWILLKKSQQNHDFNAREKEGFLLGNMDTMMLSNSWKIRDTSTINGWMRYFWRIFKHCAKCAITDKKYVFWLVSHLQMMCFWCSSIRGKSTTCCTCIF